MFITITLLFIIIATSTPKNTDGSSTQPTSMFNDVKIPDRHHFMFSEILNSCYSNDYIETGIWFNNSTNQHVQNESN